MENCVPFQVVKGLQNVHQSNALSRGNENKSLPESEKPDGFSCEFDIIPYRNGSVMVSLGKTKVLCSVSLRSASNFCAIGSLKCDVKYMPYSGYIESVSHCVSNGLQEAFISSQVIQAIEPSIRLELYPKLTISLKLIVLETNPQLSNDLSACVIAASLSLVLAKVEVLDIVSSCTLHFNNRESNASYEAQGRSVGVTVCMMTSINESTNVLIDGRISKDQISSVHSACADGCKRARESMDSCIRNYYTNL